MSTELRIVILENSYLLKSNIFTYETNQHKNVWWDIIISVNHGIYSEIHFVFVSHSYLKQSFLNLLVNENSIPMSPMSLDTAKCCAVLV